MLTPQPIHNDLSIEIAIPDGLVGRNDLPEAHTAKLGGHPVWLTDSSSPPICFRCTSPLYLLVQFENSWSSNVDRILYIFCCNSRECSQDPSGWRVIVQTVKDAGEVTNTPTSFFDSLMEENDKVDQLGDQIGSLSLHGPKPTSVAFPAHYLQITDEILVEKVPAKKICQSTIDRAMNACGGDFEAEAYEKARPVWLDKTTVAFQKRVSHYPRQVVRIGSVPLPFSSLQHPVPLCSCGGEKRFEFQLMPAILSILPVESDSCLGHIPRDKLSSHPLVANGMEWATVLVYTCQHCDTEEASVVIQTEPEFQQFQ